MQRFEWDFEKAIRNEQVHKVSFVEAASVFEDIHSLTIFDEAHSDEEDRYIDLGLSSKGRLLIVVYTERENIIRIISSWLADNNARKDYEQNR